jgi:hypothetical protein
MRDLAEGNPHALVADEISWDLYYWANREAFVAMAAEALREHARGETRPLEELIEERVPASG